MSKKGKLSNILVWIILGLLIVGLAGFGTGNFGGTVRSVATVGETEIDTNTYARALQQRLRAIGDARGEPITMAEAQAQGVDTVVLQELLAAAALEEAARLAGLSVGDARVGEQVRSIPGFQGVDGQFNRETYEFALERAGLTVPEFEADVRAELSRNLLQVAAAQGVQPLPAYSEAIYDFLGETRTVSFALLTEAALEAPVPARNEDEVQAYYDANSAEFTLPGHKAITYAWLTPDMILDSVEVSEDALRAAYDARREEFDIPARRLVERLGFPDEAAAQAAREAIEAGETDFGALLAERGLTPDDVDLGFVEQSDLDAAGAEVFALEDTGVVGPLPSPVGPALFRVNAILTPRNVPFEEARETLRADLARDRALEVISSEIEPLNDLLAGGATLEDLAAESEMTLGTIDWRGPAEGIAAYDAFNTAADAVTEDDFPEIEMAEDGSIFALRLDATVPPQVPPLDAIRDAVAAGAQAAAIRDALAARAEEMVTELSAGGSFDTLGLTAITREGITRRSAVEGLPAGAVETIFDLDPGSAAVLPVGSSVALLRLESATLPDPGAADAQAVREAMNRQASQAMAEDVLSTLARWIETQTGISINQTALNAVHSQIQ
jgi:peptidyl-prolyl cis-trans isomerase D